MPLFGKYAGERTLQNPKQYLWTSYKINVWVNKRANLISGKSKFEVGVFIKTRNGFTPTLRQRTQAQYRFHPAQKFTTRFRATPLLLSPGFNKYWHDNNPLRWTIFWKKCLLNSHHAQVVDLPQLPPIKMDYLTCCAAPLQVSVPQTQTIRSNAL